MISPEPTTMPLIASAPFVAVILLIAILPLALPTFWQKNRNKALLIALISLPILIYLLINFRPELWHTVRDYLSFIILLASLYIISGGIMIRGDIKATPAVNTAFLIIGAVIANLIGTTGASMVLIRPLLRTNGERNNTGHIPLFFIFIVSNIGGLLTPIGDPPLFLGYLNGVPFTWTLRLFPIWIITLAIVLAIFYIWDTLAYKKETSSAIARDINLVQPLKFSGIINIFFLIGVVLSVALQFPSPYRELIMVIMALLSLLFSKKKDREENRFTFHPISEVAILFAGIFITMVPILIYLHLNSAQFGITKPWQFFWCTGGLSSFLDNTPTYITFFSMAQGVTQSAQNVGIPVVAGVQADLLHAISCGAVFMGANTYIGNGPNFMVKSIAEEQHVKIPHFFAYMAYSGLILIPIFILVTFIFYR